MRDAVAVGTERKTPQGYINVKTEHGWELKHRLVMEAHLERPLQYNERVGFVDGDKTNCDLDNLYLTTTVKLRGKDITKRLDHIEQELQSIRALLSERSDTES